MRFPAILCETVLVFRRQAFVNHLYGFAARGGSFLRIGEVGLPDNLAVFAYPRLPKIASLGSRSMNDANVAGRVVRLFGFVELILGVRDDSQVDEPVVERIAVDVVNLIHRPFSVRDEPRKTMRDVARSGDANYSDRAVATSAAPCDLTGSASVPSLRVVGVVAPAEDSSGGIEVKNRTNKVGGKVVFELWHAALSLISPTMNSVSEILCGINCRSAAT